jgi:hypothetical protein
MKIKVTVYGEDFYFKPYKTKHLKRALFELGQHKDQSIENTINVYYDVLVDKDAEKFNTPEKLYIMMILKSKIDDNEHKIQYTCKHCDQVTEGIVHIDSSISINNTDVEIPTENGSLLLKYASSLEEAVSTDELDELTIQEYNLVESIFKFIEPKLKFVGACNCFICSQESIINFDDEYLTKLLIPFTFIELYKYEAYMKLNGYTLEEISNMYPYELELYKTITENFTKPQG